MSLNIFQEGEIVNSDKSQQDFKIYAFRKFISFNKNLICNIINKCVPLLPETQKVHKNSLFYKTKKIYEISSYERLKKNVFFLIPNLVNFFQMNLKKIFFFFLFLEKHTRNKESFLIVARTRRCLDIFLFLFYCFLLIEMHQQWDHWTGAINIKLVKCIEGFIFRFFFVCDQVFPVNSYSMVELHTYTRSNLSLRDFFFFF